MEQQKTKTPRKTPTTKAQTDDLAAAAVKRAARTAGDILDDVGRRTEPVARTVGTAWSTAVGQSSEAAERVVSTIGTASRQVTGQARAQAARSSNSAKQAKSELFDDATRALDPDSDGQPAALEDRTKDDLYEMAKDLDIDGRSSMSKAQLVTAIRRTS